MAASARLADADPHHHKRPDKMLQNRRTSGQRGKIVRVPATPESPASTRALAPPPPDLVAHEPQASTPATVPVAQVLAPPYGAERPDYEKWKYGYPPFSGRMFGSGN